MPGTTRRRILKSGVALAGGGMLTALSPEFVRGVSDLVILGQQNPDLSGTRTIANFLAGSGPQELGIQSAALMEPQGPNAIAARADGSLAILDTVNRRIAIVRGDRTQRTISLPTTVYPADLQESGGRLYVLDSGGNQIIEVDDYIVRSQRLPAQSFGRTSGLVDAGNGTIGVVEEDAASYRLTDGRTALAPGYPVGGGEIVRIEYEHSTLARRRASVFLGSTKVPVATRGFLGSVTVAGADAAGRVYLLISELIRGQIGNEVDLVLQRIERNGSVSAITRVPVRNRWYNPTRAVTIASSGQAFAIFPTRSGTILLELSWVPQISALAAPFILDAPKFEALAVNPIGVCRQAAWDTANTYYSHAWYCSQANYDLCTQSGYTSQRPAFITGLGWYGWVPYDWGGWVTVAGFDSDMAANKTAGNTSLAVVACSSGVDCSGFIQRCWGINNAKYNDTGLLSWCTNVAVLDQYNPPPWMQRSDMYRLPGQHVRMHDQYQAQSTGVYVFEAAGDPGRVGWGYYSWAQLNGYEWCLGSFSC